MCQSLHPVNLPHAQSPADDTRLCLTKHLVPKRYLFQMPRQWGARFHLQTRTHTSRFSYVYSKSRMRDTSITYMPSRPSHGCTHTIRRETKHNGPNLKIPSLCNDLFNRGCTTVVPVRGTQGFLLHYIKHAEGADVEQWDLQQLPERRLMWRCGQQSAAWWISRCN